MVTLLHFLTTALFAHGSLIVAKPQFEIDVPTPKRARICGNLLYILSQSKPRLWKVDLAGASPFVKSQVSMPFPAGEITAMDCVGTEPLFGVRTKGRANVASASLFFRGKLVSVPGGGEIKDIRCRPEVCAVLRNILHFLEPKSFKPTKTERLDPTTLKLTDTTQMSSHKENPFRDWQEHYVLADPTYSRVILSDTSEGALLDPMRSAILRFSNKENFKFGKWGTQESQWYTPKAMSALLNDSLLVGDPGSGLISVFSLSPSIKGAHNLGTHYLGTLGEIKGDRKSFLTFKSVIDLDRKIGTGYVLILATDLAFQRVIGIKVSTPLDVLSYPNDPLFKWPRNDTHQCLQCHDGTLTDSLASLNPTLNHHPKAKCSDCHSHHHVNYSESKKQQCQKCHAEIYTSKTSHPIPGLECLKCHQMHSAEPKQLKQKSPELCISCHKSTHLVSHPESKAHCLDCHQVHHANRADTLAKNPKSCLACHKDKSGGDPSASPHLTGTAMIAEKFIQSTGWNKAEITCVSCHKPHDSKEPKSCLSCHMDRNQKHQAPIIISKTSRAEGITLAQQKVVCLTCHDPHMGKRNPVTIQNFCSSCHGAKTQTLYEQFHKRRNR